MSKVDSHASYLKSTFTVFLVLISTQAIALDDSALSQKIQSLDWQTTPDKYQLTGTSASVITSTGEYLLEGKEAHEYARLTQGHDGFKPDAVVVRVEYPRKGTQVSYTFNEIGFVKMDDWEEQINKDTLLEEIKNGTEGTNKIREEGHASLHVDGWAQEPYLDRENATIYWAISSHDSEGGSTVNAKALKLGRKGFTEILWVGPPALFANAQASLSPALAAYQYDEGFTYADFVPDSDAVSALGAGALAYKLIGGKVAAKAGVGVLALLAILVKKLSFLVLVPLAFAWKWIKRFFIKSKDGV